jgi:hypothetical protein
MLKIKAWLKHKKELINGEEPQFKLMFDSSGKRYALRFLDGQYMGENIQCFVHIQDIRHCISVRQFGSDLIHVQINIHADLAYGGGIERIINCEMNDIIFNR